MAATILSGTQTPTGNYTLYTNNTSGNVRLIIHHLFVHGESNKTTYSTRRVNITGGSHGTLQLPANPYFQTNPTAVQRISLGVGKDIASENIITQIPQSGVIVTGGDTLVSQNGTVRTVVIDPIGTAPKSAIGPQVFPTEILMRPNQSMVFEASSSTSQQYISFNITVMPEDG